MGNGKINNYYEFALFTLFHVDLINILMVSIYSGWRIDIESYNFIRSVSNIHQTALSHDKMRNHIYDLKVL